MGTQSRPTSLRYRTPTEEESGRVCEYTFICRICLDLNQGRPASGRRFPGWSHLPPHVGHAALSRPVDQPSWTCGALPNGLGILDLGAEPCLYRLSIGPVDPLPRDAMLRIWQALARRLKSGHQQPQGYQMFITLMKLWKNEDGATAIEYGLIAALIAVAAIAAMQLVGTSLTSTFNNVASDL
jgi:pilus assembly protein Flp/PilA